MDVAKFPTSTFVLTAPIDFGAVPADGATVNATATGDLTLHGTTKSVTFNVQGTSRTVLSACSARSRWCSPIGRSLPRRSARSGPKTTDCLSSCWSSNTRDPVRGDLHLE